MSAQVDLVIPTYNGREYLDGCLTALERQTYGDFHVTVVDDGSTDGTAEHLRDRWSMVKVLALPRNVGLAAAINRALDTSTSEFVALLNNDTEVEPGWLEALVESLERHPEAAAATSKLLLVRPARPLSLGGRHVLATRPTRKPRCLATRRRTI